MCLFSSVFLCVSVFKGVSVSEQRKTTKRESARINNQIHVFFQLVETSNIHIHCMYIWKKETKE